METAIQLFMEQPDAPALTILDRAMQGHEGTHPDFDSCCNVSCARPHPAYGDDLYPPSPFAELLRRAFAPQFDPREAAVLGLVDQDVEPNVQARLKIADERWQIEVINRFAERFKLWQ
jgi:hypothetical protein